MTIDSAKVYVVDDDASFRRILSRLLQAHGLEAESFASAATFLASGLAERTGCILLDVRMPELNGLDLHEELIRGNCTMPIIFLTGHGNIPMTVRAMKQGAADFLTKPVDADILLRAIRKALEENQRRVGDRMKVAETRARIRTLTPREYEVMKHVITGELNKQIDGDLDITEKTVKVHRARALEKMGVHSVAELVRVCTLAGIEPTTRADDA
jgi:FixJ family two-component response regulator